MPGSSQATPHRTSLDHLQYPFLTGWTSVGRRPKKDALKNVGELNDFLLAAHGVERKPNEAHRGEAKVTYEAMIKELDDLARKSGPSDRTIYRKMHLNRDPIENGKYMTRAFEAFSTDPNAPVPSHNYVLRVSGRNSSVDLQRFNPEQKEALMRPFQVFRETGRAQQGALTVIDLEEEGHSHEAEYAALETMFGRHGASDSASESGDAG